MVGRRAPEERLNDTKSTDVKIGIHNFFKKTEKRPIAVHYEAATKQITLGFVWTLWFSTLRSQLSP
jgi:hypothetical protein